MNCSHNGFHSGRGRYSSDTGYLHYVVVCDDCESELSEIHRESYRPSYDPHGNDEFLSAA